MKSKLYPLLFEPVYKNYIWGGDKIYSFFKRTPSILPCAESWEISDRDEGLSIVKNGTLKGRNLKEIMEEFASEITGKKNTINKKFPLLIKILDAKEDLSIQVHPANDNTTRGVEAKTEMWYVLDARKEAFVYAGFTKQTNEMEFSSKLTTGTITKLIRKVPVSVGDVIFIPGGRIHAVGAGCLLLEIQQNSNTTYRVFDWDRTDKNGKKRPLHISEAIKHINLEDTLPPQHSPSEVAQNNKSTMLLLECDFFRVEKINIEKELFIIGHNSFEILFIERGNVAVKSDLEPDCLTTVMFGSTCLIPSSILPYRILPIASQITPSVIRILPGRKFFT